MPGGSEIAFLCQDPKEHHQIAMVGGLEAPDAAFVMVDHLAFRTGTRDDLRVLRGELEAAGVEPILPICHGNAWSLYFNDCEGNGLECFVDTPFHVAQPFARGFDLDQSDEEIVAATRKLVEGEPEFQPMAEWQAAFARIARDSSKKTPTSDGWQVRLASSWRRANPAVRARRRRPGISPGKTSACAALAFRRRPTYARRNPLSGFRR